MDDNFLIVDESSLDTLRALCEKYPASSFTAFYYAKMMQLLHPEEYERAKGLHLMHILDRARFSDFRIDTEEEPMKKEAASYDFATSLREGSAVDSTARKTTEEPVEQSVIINQLIAELDVETPKIQFDPERHDATANYSKSSLMEDPEIVSETLARLYLQQGYSGKAIKIYKKLALLFPEKSCYFAALIQEAKNSKNQ